MIEVEYYFNASSQWIRDFADAFSKSARVEIVCKENKLIFPPSVASGRFEYYELSGSLGILCVDTVFQEDVLLLKKQSMGNDYYALIFDVSDEKIKVNQSDGKKVCVLDEFVKLILLSSHAFNSSVLFPKNSHVRYVQLFIHRSWGIKNLAEDIPLEFIKFKDSINSLPMRSVVNFDPKSYELVNRILELDITRSNLIQTLEGYACQLIALFFNNLREEYEGKEKVKSQDAIRIVELKERQEQNLLEILPLANAAKACFMSVTKFSAMFSALFKENYGEYFIHKKMEKAKQLLKEGYTVSNISQMLGYNNMSYFAKVFKKHYGVVPQDYKKSKNE